MTTVPTRSLRLTLPLIAILFLAACDAPQLLPPDARLPDGSTYSGDIQDGLFHGEGVQEFANGMVYSGQFREGYWHGQGELESPAGWRYEGEFQNGTMSGQGVFEDDGSRYEGEFRNGEFVDQEEYVAEEPVPEEPAPLTEKILAEDRQRLNNQIESLAPERSGETDAYFLAVGGDGTESVFKRDIQVAKAGLQAQFDVEKRSIMLLNHRDYETFPLASRPSIETALKALDARMNPEEDLLVVHLVSHGMQDGQLLLQQPGIELPNLSPEDFAEMLEPLNARRKLLVVSACYSGQWIEPLKDENTLIMTSAREDRTSFGCGDDSEMTWFTKAVYQSVGLSLTDPDAMFEQINQQIRTWEEEIGMEEERWSYPQSHLGESLREWIR
ncbi:caspase family protein [Marinobacter sp. 71-i]|uniref:Caspase family protein n=1 Tax=Marinobacter iranensis TaxID=2962607 RepID=A0ABT5YBA4_9GAMM|nr:C13 family peptidase [Marinobacter iranensis]MDF0750953.1 caspase family protein [Marinobacter iranensis]